MIIYKIVSTVDAPDYVFIISNKAMKEIRFSYLHGMWINVGGDIINSIFYEVHFKLYENL